MNRILQTRISHILSLKGLAFLLVLLGINLTVTTNLSAQILSPGANKPDTSVEQNPNPEALINVFLDCRGCNEGFIKSEIAFVNFVRDMADAEVHLIITRRGTASGGTQYQLSYLGYQSYTDMNQNLTYTSFDSDTYDEERNGLVKYVKLGLIPYLSQKDALNDFELEYTGDMRGIPTSTQDKWNNWIFEIGSNGSIRGEENRQNVDLDNRIRVRRVTETWKFQLYLNNSYRRNTYITSDSLGREIKDDFVTDRQNVFGLLAYAINDHWSVGSYFNGGSSSRDNIDLWYGATPSIEYSFYPYREFARREVTLRYGLYSAIYDYSERTIFGKDSEFLVRQELAFNMDYTKPWGGLEARINGRTYLHDFSKNRLNMQLELNMRIVRGFSVFVNTEYSIINDQLSLSAGGVTDKEAIANTRQQATSYSYRASAGFEISFGSIYDSVVNTRF